MTGNPQPLGGNEMPRFAGIATFMRLPGRSHPSDLDVAIVGVPFDIGTSNRPGARFEPRGIRDESVLIRPYNMATRAAPFDSLRIDDTGDVATNPYNLLDSVARIEAHFNELVGHGVITVALGGGPVYLSFDIDGLDPSFAPGTGTPEIGGLTTPQALEIIRGCRGLDLVGCDLVEVAPIYDTSGMTAHIAADLVYEMLCVLPGVQYRS